MSSSVLGCNPSGRGSLWKTPGQWQSWLGTIVGLPVLIWVGKHTSKKHIINYKGSPNFSLSDHHEPNWVTYFILTSTYLNYITPFPSRFHPGSMPPLRFTGTPAWTRQSKRRPANRSRAPAATVTRVAWVVRMAQTPSILAGKCDQQQMADGLFLGIPLKGIPPFIYWVLH